MIWGVVSKLERCVEYCLVTVRGLLPIILETCVEKGHVRVCGFGPGNNLGDLRTVRG